VATKPYFTESTPPSKTLGIVEVAVFAASIEPRSAGCENHVDVTPEQVGGHFCQNALIVRPPEFDGHVLALDISGVSEAPAEIGYDLLGGFERRSIRETRSPECPAAARAPPPATPLRRKGRAVLLICNPQASKLARKKWPSLWAAETPPAPSVNTLFPRWAIGCGRSRPRGCSPRTARSRLFCPNAGRPRAPAAANLRQLEKSKPSRRARKLAGVPGLPFFMSA
jgi:hypothetical protein